MYMKKLAKTLLTLAVTAGLALSVSAFSACGDGREVLIDGDYSAQATETQLTTLREYASKTSDDLLGDSSASGWSYNARYNASGDVVAGIEMSAEGQTVGMNMGMNVNYDHVISLANSETGPSVRGSGNMNYNMTVDMAIPGMEAQDVSISLDGASRRTTTSISRAVRSRSCSGSRSSPKTITRNTCAAGWGVCSSRARRRSKRRRCFRAGRRCAVCSPK